MSMRCQPGTADGHAQRGTLGFHRGEVPVVANRSHRGAHGRIDETVRHARTVERDVERVDEARRDRNMLSGVCVDPREIRISAEAAARAIDVGDHVLAQSARFRQHVAVSDEHDSGGPECGEARLIRARGHDWPDTTPPPPLGSNDDGCGI